MDSRSSKTTRRLRARLIISGFTYSKFAARLGVSRATVKAALYGKRGGPAAKLVLDSIEKLPNGR